MVRAMINGQQVRDAMTFRAVTGMPDDTVRDALDLLVANDVAPQPRRGSAASCSSSAWLQGAA